MEVIKLTNKNQNHVIAKASEALGRNELIIYPTETCYGAGVDSVSQEAVNKLLEYKTQRGDKPISVAVCNQIMAEEYAILNDTALNIIRNFLPGPITVVCKGKHKLAQGVESASGTIGLRIPDYSLILKIVETFGRPVTATSANASYKKTPYSIDDILENTSHKQQELIGLAIDAGTLPKRKPSSVVDTTLEGIHILREGDILFKDCQVFLSSSEAETDRFAGQIFSKLEEYVGKRLVVFQLYGDLGAGKTYFTKFFARYLKVEETIVSPTFILCNEYKTQYNSTPIHIYHIDAYRMYSPSEMEDLGTDRMFASPNMIFIEWANKVAEYIAPYLKNAIVVKIRLEHVSLTTRRIEYSISY